MVRIGGRSRKVLLTPSFIGKFGKGGGLPTVINARKKPAAGLAHGVSGVNKINENNIVLYDVMQIDLVLASNGGFTNPFLPYDATYAPGGVNVIAAWKTPITNTIRKLPAFFQKNFTVSGGASSSSNTQEVYTASGGAFWSARMMVEELGLYEVTFTITDVNGVRSTFTTNFQTAASGQKGHGPLKKHPLDSSIFVHWDGTPWHGMGLNLQNSSDGDNRDGSGQWGRIPGLGGGEPGIIDEAASYGLNWFRMFEHTEGRTLIESADTDPDGAVQRPAGTYSHAIAFRVETFIKKCHEKDVVAQLCMNAHGDWQEGTSINRFSHNAYADTASAGWMATPLELYDATANGDKARWYLKARTRYEFARWGAYPGVKFESWNEQSSGPGISGVNAFDATVKPKYMTTMIAHHSFMKNGDGSSGMLPQGLPLGQPTVHSQVHNASPATSVGTRGFDQLFTHADLDEADIHHYNFSENESRYPDHSDQTQALQDYQSIGKAAAIGESGLARDVEYTGSQGADRMTAAEITGQPAVWETAYDAAAATDAIWTQNRKNMMRKWIHGHNYLAATGINGGQGQGEWWDSQFQQDSLKQKNNATQRPQSFVSDPSQGFPTWGVVVPYLRAFFAGEDLAASTPLNYGAAHPSVYTQAQVERSNNDLGNRSRVNLRSLAPTSGVYVQARRHRANDRAIAWYRDVDNEFISGLDVGSARADITGQAFTITGLTAGLYRAETMNLWYPAAAGSIKANGYYPVGSGGAIRHEIAAFKMSEGVKFIRETALVAGDTFTRSATDSMGTADVGGAWTIAGATANYDVNGSVFVFSAIVNGTIRGWLGAMTQIAEGTWRMKFRMTSAHQTGFASNVYLTGRNQDIDQNYVRLAAVFGNTGLVQLAGSVIVAGSTSLNIITAVTIGRETHAQNKWFWLEMQLVGTGANLTMNGRIWADGTPRPATADVTGTTAVLNSAVQPAGRAGLRANPTGAITGSYTWEADNYSVVA